MRLSIDPEIGAFRIGRGEMQDIERPVAESLDARQLEMRREALRQEVSSVTQVHVTARFAQLRCICPISTVPSGSTRHELVPIKATQPDDLAIEPLNVSRPERGYLVKGLIGQSRSSPHGYPASLMPAVDPVPRIPSARGSHLCEQNFASVAPSAARIP